MVHYKVTLTAPERDQLKAIMSKGKHTSQQFRNACILINCDSGKFGQPFSNEQVAQMLQVTAKTVERLKQRFVEEGFEACIDRKPYPEVKEIKADGDPPRRRSPDLCLAITYLNRLKRQCINNMLIIIAKQVTLRHQVRHHTIPALHTCARVVR